MLAELSGVICGGIVLLPHVYVMCMCVYVNVVACSERSFCWTARIASFVLIRTSRTRVIQRTFKGFCKVY